MTAAYRIVASMDIHHQNDDHDVQYRLGKTKYPTEDSIDEFELFICPYDENHKINSKRWRYHLERCKKNYGGHFGKCPFNASHHIPGPELEYHTLYCPDRNVIRQDLEGGKSNWKISTQVNHNPQWNQPVGGTEDWDQEEEDVPSFFLNPDKGMPLALLPQKIENTTSEQDEDEGYYQDENFDQEHQEVHHEEAPAPIKSVLDETLLPKQPPNWSEMTKTQKKNYKKKYDRQQQRMKDEDVTADDFNRRRPAIEMTEEERNAKLAAIKAAYPLNNEKQNATRVDYTSLLNIVCQKIRLNLPEYEPISAVHGGFAFRVRVHQTWYEGHDYCTTKKDGKHDAAKWALLGMDIPGLGGSGNATMKPKPVHPREREQNQQMREADELGKLMAAGYYPQHTKHLRQPNIQSIGSPPKQNQVAQQSFPSSQPDLSQQGQQHHQDPLQQHKPQQQQLQPSNWDRLGSNSIIQQDKQLQNIQKQQEEYEQKQFQLQLQERQRQRQQQQQNQPSSHWNGWGSSLSTQHQQQPLQYQQHQKSPFQQLSQLEQQPVQQPQQRQPISQWNGWGSNPIAQSQNSLQQQQQQHQHQQVLNNAPPSAPWQCTSAMQNLDIKSGEDFPSLGGNVWKAVPKTSTGLTNVRRNAGRGRGTSMKL